MSDIPREEVERVLEELRKTRAMACGDFGTGLDAAADRLEALLKPKQYQVEDQEAVVIRYSDGSTSTNVSTRGGKWQGEVVARRVIKVPPLEHGEGIE